MECNNLQNRGHVLVILNPQCPDWGPVHSQSSLNVCSMNVQNFFIGYRESILSVTFYLETTNHKVIVWRYNYR